MAIPVLANKNERKVTSNATSTTIGAPSGIQDGDVLVLILCTDGDQSAPITWPSGFTPIHEQNLGNAIFVGAAFKIASGESGNYDVSWPDNEQAILFIYRITGAVSGDEIQDPDESNDSGTTANPATITPVASTDTDDSLVIVVAGMDDDDITIDGGGDADYVVVDVDKSNTGNGTCSCGVQRRDVATSAVPPTCDLTLTSNEQWIVFWFAVRSIAPGGGGLDIPIAAYHHMHHNQD